MTKKTARSKVTIELTLEQQEQIRQATGLEVAALDRTPEELEERAVPYSLKAHVAICG